jgi:hypothetical protein
VIDLAAERPENPDILFVGGTGRSGTHVISQLLDSVECRCAASNAIKSIECTRMNPSRKIALVRDNNASCTIKTFNTY